MNLHPYLLLDWNSPVPEREDHGSLVHALTQSRVQLGVHVKKCIDDLASEVGVSVGGTILPVHLYTVRLRQ